MVNTFKLDSMGSAVSLHPSVLQSQGKLARHYHSISITPRHPRYRFTNLLLASIWSCSSIPCAALSVNSILSIRPSMTCSWAIYSSGSFRAAGSWQCTTIHERVASLKSAPRTPPYSWCRNAWYTSAQAYQMRWYPSVMGSASIAISGWDNSLSLAHGLIAPAFPTLP